VTNTFFQHRDEHTASWRSNTGTHWATLDLVLISRRFRSSVLDTRVLPAAVSHDSDHRLVVCDLHLRLKAPPATSNTSSRATTYNLATLDQEEVRGKYAAAVATAYAALLAAWGPAAPTSPTASETEGEWQAFLAAVIAAADSHIGRRPPRTRDAPWISAATKQLCMAKQAAFMAWQQAERSAQLPRPTTAMEVVLAAGAAAAAAAAKVVYRQLVASARRAATLDKNTALQAKAAEMDGHMQARRLRLAFRIANDLAGKPHAQQASAIQTPAGGIVFGSGVVHVLARHFEGVLNVATVVAPVLLAAVPTSPALAGSSDNAAIAAAATAARTAAAPPMARPAPPIRTRRQQAQAQVPAGMGLPLPPSPPRPTGPAEPDLQEVAEAIAMLRNTCPGLDKVAAAMLKHGGAATTEWMHRVIVSAWRSGTAPAAWKQAQLVALHKKGNRLLPDNYRGVTLLSVCGKAYVTLIHRRIRDQLCGQLLDAQNGFRKGRGTGDALFSMRRLQELARQHGAPLHTAFVDFRKAFDSVNREALWRVLLARGVDPKLLGLIKDLYSGCQACISSNGTTSQWFPMSSGVRQGCPMSPTLFNVFIDFLARLVIAACEEQGVRGFTVAFRINGQLVAAPVGNPSLLALLMLLYADDMVLLAPSAAALHVALLALERITCDWGMAINYDKTKIVVFSPPHTAAPSTAAAAQQPTQQQPSSQHAACALQAGTVAEVSHFSYLGSIAESGCQQEREISKRLRTAGVAFSQMQRRVFAARGVSLATKMAIYKAAVVPSLLYGAAESWAPTAAQLQRLDVFNTSCLRRITHTRRESCMPNEELYRLTGQPAISALLRAHRLRWLGHVARTGDNAAVKQLMFAHEVPGMACLRGRPSITWPDVAKGDMDMIGVAGDWYDMCQDRAVWRDVVSGCSTVG
jgi:hypothetical protein